MKTYETTILRCDDNGNEVEIPVLVYYSEYAGCRGKRDTLCGVRGTGPQLEPDEPAHVEVERAIRMDTGYEVCLIHDEQDRIELEICELEAH